MNGIALTAILLCILALSAGQVLFKLAADRLNRVGEAGSLWMAYLANPYLWAAGILYAATALGWIWALRQVDLVVAYPFAALAFIFVPLLSIGLLGEAVDWRYWLGTGFIVIGIGVMHVR